MIPCSNFESFYDALVEAYNGYGDNESITFGILLADYQQDEARQYILNYLQDYHEKSGRCFNFFIPGYIAVWDQSPDEDENINVGGTDYRFSPEMFRSFYQSLENQFGITYEENPMLILMSMDNCHLGTARWIVIDLNTINRGVRYSGSFFRDIFEIASRDWSLEAIRNRRRFLYIKGDLLDRLLEDNRLAWLGTVIRNGIQYYRINEHDD